MAARAGPRDAARAETTRARRLLGEVGGGRRVDTGIGRTATSTRRATSTQRHVGTAPAAGAIVNARAVTGRTRVIALPASFDSFDGSSAARRCVCVRGRAQRAHCRQHAVRRTIRAQVRGASKTGRGTLPVAQACRLESQAPTWGGRDGACCCYCGARRGLPEAWGLPGSRSARCGRGLMRMRQPRAERPHLKASERRNAAKALAA